MEFDLESEPAIELGPEPELESEPLLELEPEPEPELAMPQFEDLPAAAELEEPEPEPEPVIEELTLEPEPEPELIEELSPVEELTLLPDIDEDALDQVLTPQPQDDLFGAPELEAPIFAEETNEPFFGVEGLGDALGVEDVPLEEIGEVDFYIEQELFDEARRKLESLQARFPDHPDVTSRSERVAAASAAASAAAAAAAPRPPVFSRDEIESELLSAIPDDDDDFSVPPPQPQPQPQPELSAALVQEENLFADEDNFFDLAAELESELADEEEAISLSEEEQSLEEIFREFKKGVEQQLDSEDYDTHYNLGIAYKEMGLIDEAIGEFQLASKDPKRAVECASMLGLCFLEKGMPQLAIKWYRKGIEMPEVTEDEHVGLLYDLASAYQEVGDTDNAQKAFMEVYGMNSNYRDIVSRIKQLEDAKR
jgi:pilus assembly protein FimV